MKKCFTAIAAIMLLQFSVAAQQQKFSRVLLHVNKADMRTLSAAGITVDHGNFEKDKGFTGEFSSEELAIMKRKGINYDVLIDDLASYVRERNKKPLPEEKEEALDACNTYRVPKNFTLGSMGGFYTYNEMLAVLDDMRAKYPKLITVKQVVSNSLTTAQGRPLYYVKISDHPETDEAEPQILYTALHHAREPLSATQLLYYMWYLLENYKKNVSVKNLVDSTEMYFIPCLNPDGYIYNETTDPNGGGYWRKNRRNNGDGNYGVDLNRNYGYKWGYDDGGSSPNTWSDTYRGSSAFSEPETQMVRDFCNSHHFSFSLNNHTYSNVLVRPYGHKANVYTPDSASYADYAAILTDCNNFDAGTAIETVGYYVNGASDDWMYGEQTTKPKIFAFTPETGSSFDGFWPPASKIVKLCKKNMDMNLAAASFAKEDGSPVAKHSKIYVANNQLAIITQASPNPCSNYAYIDIKTKLPAGNNWQIQIANTSGTIVKTIPVNTQQQKILVNTADLQNGTYYYTLTNGKSTGSKMKLIVMK